MKKIIKFIKKIKYRINYYVLKIFHYKKIHSCINLIDSLKRTRLPKEIAKQISTGVKKNNKFLAGKTIEFMYYSKDVLNIFILYKNYVEINNMSLKSVSGIDIYEKDEQNFEWIGCFAPSNNGNLSSVATINFKSKKENHHVVIFLPGFAEISGIYIEKKYLKNIEIIKNNNDDIVIYGSSISQGCAASRPALSYANILHRMTGKKICNLGFSESAKGEETLINYLSKLNASIYVIEYDHNSDVEELRKNHLKIYKKIRENNSNSLIIFLSRLSGGLSIEMNECQERNSIIKSTYKYAIDSGDKNVVFIDGSKIITDEKSKYFTDDRHPNDIGMQLIADKLYEIIKEKAN